VSKQLILIDSDLSADQFKSVCPMEAGPIEALQSLENYVVALEGGNQMADVSAKVGAVQATATVTMTGTAANNETMKLCNETLTAKTSGADPEAGEFNISATPNTQADSLVLAINSMPELAGLVTAARTGTGVVTITAVIPGVMGNGLECADVNLANTAVVGFADGSDGTEYSLASK
jgi:phage tail sheath gpL-like